MNDNLGEPKPLARSRPLGEIVIESESNNGFDPLHPLHLSHLKISGKDPLTLNFDSIESFLKIRGITALPASRYAEGKRLILSSPPYENPEELANYAEKLKYAVGDFVQIKAIVENYTQLQEFPKNLVTAFFKDSLIPNNKVTPGRNFLFEHFVGARFSTAGCEVIQYEPDFICTYKGVRFGIAAKKLSIHNLQSNISKAKKQIIKSGIQGLIVLDVSSDFLKIDKLMFVGGYDDYMRGVRAWMNSHYRTQIRARWKEWGLDNSIIPAVIAFNIGTFLNSHTGMIQNVVHMSVFAPGPISNSSENQRQSAKTIFESIECVRRTLVDSE